MRKMWERGGDEAYAVLPTPRRAQHDGVDRHRTEGGRATGSFELQCRLRRHLPAGPGPVDLAAAVPEGESGIRCQDAPVIRRHHPVAKFGSEPCPRQGGAGCRQARRGLARPQLLRLARRVPPRRRNGKRKPVTRGSGVMRMAPLAPHSS